MRTQTRHARLRGTPTNTKKWFVWHSPTWKYTWYCKHILLWSTNSKQIAFGCLQYVHHIKVRPHLHANTNEAGQGEACATRCHDCKTRQNVVVHRASEWFTLKYWLQADSVHLASDRTDAVFLSSVTRLHCYACLASACLAHVFVLMWMRLK